MRNGAKYMERREYQKEDIKRTNGHRTNTGLTHSNNNRILKEQLTVILEVKSKRNNNLNRRKEKN